MLRITPTIAIDESELRLEAVRASGPGGQNVNKVATAIQLRFDVRGSAALPDDVKERLIRLAGKRVTGGGVLMIKAQRYRTQQRNQQDAIDRLTHWLRRAAQKPKPRRKTRPTAASKERRLAGKQHRGKAKRMRQRVSDADA